MISAGKATLQRLQADADVRSCKKNHRPKAVILNQQSKYLVSCSRQILICILRIKRFFQGRNTP